jgi:hypothetical protein
MEFDEGPGSYRFFGCGPELTCFLLSAALSDGILVWILRRACLRA